MGEQQGTPLSVAGGGQIDGYVPLQSLGPLEFHIFELTTVGN
jgi:hypothetical protein